MKYANSIPVALILAMCGVLLFARAGRSQTTEIVFDITVTRYIDTYVTDFEVAQDYQAATSLLKTNDPSTCTPADVACCITLSKSGFISSFGVSGTGYGIIDTQAKQNEVWAITQGEVKVVDDITYPSSSWGSAPWPAPAVRTAIMVVGADPDVWAHEFGHGQGLDHNNFCTKYIMHYNAPNTNVVTNTDCDGMRTLKAPYHYGSSCSGVFPSPSQCYFVPQSGSLSNPNEGAIALMSFRRCPNNDGTQNLPNNARLKVVLHDSSDLPVPGVPASSIYIQFNGGTPAQGFAGAGDDSIIATLQYNPAANCPDVRYVWADAPSDGNGIAYITLIGANPTAPGVGVRDPFRKWGAYAGDVPVFVNGTQIQGRLTSTSINGSYTAHVKNLDFVGGRTTSLNLGEVVNSLDTNAVQGAINTGVYHYERDFQQDGFINSLDYNMVRGHIGHNCNTPLAN